MKTFPKTFLYFLITASLVVIGYTLSTGPAGGLVNYAYADSTEGDTTDVSGEYTTQDVSGMYNERGFLKSNSTSMDENEIVSDFNGNLMYSIPLVQYKELGDIAMNLSLNYNGSTGHSIITSNISNANTGVMNQYNFSSPEWIFSLNGMAIQLLNFEDNFFTNSISGLESNVKNRNVHLLVPGYQLTDKFHTTNPDDPDYITLLTGDGSTITLENKAGNTDYVGWYYTSSKKSYIKAKVEYIENSGSWNSTTNPYRNRKVTLLKGDGLTYIYYEHKISYNDITGESNVAAYNKPQVMLLEEIKDRFGHSTKLIYDNTSGIKGRPKLKQILGEMGFIMFDYSAAAGGIVVNTNQGIYTINCDPFDPVYDNCNKRSMINYISNSDGRVMTFINSSYFRKALHMFNPASTPGSHNLNAVFDGVLGGLKRLTKVINYNGGVRDYTYAGALSLDAAMNVNNGMHIHSSQYYGQGRDIFFVNSLAGITTKNNDNKLIKSESFAYFYDAHSRGDTLTFPIKASDDYYTTRNTVSLDTSSINNTPVNTKSERKYKDYKVKVEYPNGSEIMPGISDYQGETVLIQEKFFRGNPDTLIRTIAHMPETGGSEIAGGIIVGSLLDTLITETMNESGAHKNTHYKYRYNYFGTGGNGFSTDTFDNPISSVTITDPLGRKTKTTYKLFLDSLIVFKHGLYNPLVTNVNDTVFFYQIEQPDTVSIFDVNGTRIAADANVYVTSPGSTSSGHPDGYIGQVIKSQKLHPASGSVLQETQFFYYNKDTTGKYLYTYLPSYWETDEGKLKEEISPGGNKKMFYYHPINRKEDQLYTGTSGHEWDYVDTTGKNVAALDLPNGVAPPFVSFKVELNDGSESIIRDEFTGARSPSRTDEYTDVSHMLTSYANYDMLSDNPIMSVQPNNYISRFNYDDYGRLRAAILPYDFANPYFIYQGADSIRIDTQYIHTEYTVESSGGGIIWGNHTIMFSEGTLGSNAVTDYTFDNSVSPDAENDPIHGGQTNNNNNIFGLVAFPDYTFPQNLVSVDSVIFKYPTTNYYHNIDGDTSSSNWSVKIRSLKKCAPDSVTFSGYDKTVNNLNAMHLNPDSSYCSGFLNGTYNYANFLNYTDITSLITSHVLATNPHTRFGGFLFDFALAGTHYNPEGRLRIDIDHCGGNRINPTLKISGTLRYIDTVKIKRINNATLLNQYDDVHHIMTSYAKLDKPGSISRMKKSEVMLDGFYRPISSRTYNDATHFDSTQVFYNYLGGKSKTIDANGNQTKLSYNQWGTLSKTKNADNSISLVSEGFWDTLTTSLASYSFAHKQIFTDETNRSFDKWFDAAGNLVREVKYVAGSGGDPEISDTPYDPDTTIAGLDSPGDIPLITDYKYDGLNRIIEVKTPGGKSISYGYDAMGRVTSRHTVDAGTVQFGYDKNNNLTFSQDANQRAIAFNLYTARTYDGLNRLLTVADKRTGAISDPGIDSQGDTTLTFEMDSPTGYDSLYTINCYDTLSQSPVSGFFSTHVPYDYTTKINNTKGALVATGYRTKLSEGWSFKFYRYDARGRVVKMWNKLDGMDSVKTIEYAYNSQNQVTNVNYESKHTDWKFFQYTYDDAGRLKKAGLLNQTSGSGTTSPFPPPEDSIVTDGSGGISPWTFTPFAGYTYNQNQQIDTFSINNGGRKYKYSYNNRNWVTRFIRAGGTTDYAYDMLYNPNGNIRHILTGGAYDYNMQHSGTLINKYIYDKSNRLVKVTDSVDNNYMLINNYDKDGNIVALKRYDGNGTQTDGFENTFTSGTNKLVSTDRGNTTQFTYDNNGNVITDALNRNTMLLYDYRNLLTDIKSIKTEHDPDPLAAPETTIDMTYWTKYWYDEAGNRTRKQLWRYTGTEAEPILDFDTKKTDTSVATSGGGTWNKISDEFYIRDVSGKELAIYTGHNIEQWNMYGSDNVGKIDANNHRFFYLKDHLGTVRCVLDTTNTVISANDYDAWGYPLVDRNYDASVTTQKYKFTSKELDNESNYDYFGARYYNSRIANWISIDPLFEKNISFTPFGYVSRNPLKYLDNDGRIQLPSELVGTYPKLAEFLMNDLPNFVNDAKIMNAIMEVTHLSSDQIKTDFQGGSGPTLNVTQMYGAFGYFSAKEDPNVININSSVVKDFESSAEGNDEDVMKFFISVIISHEYTHYGANKADINNFYFYDNKITQGETGQIFEIKAFGAVIGSPDMAADKMNEKNGNSKKYHSTKQNRNDKQNGF